MKTNIPSTLVVFGSLVALPSEAEGQHGISTSSAVALEDAFPGQENFDKPLYVAFHATDPGVAYVVEQNGTVFRIPRDAKGVERHVFLDWRKQSFYGKNWEEGLLGLAFDPEYATNGHLYIYYSERVTEPRRGRRSVISRLTRKVAEGAPVMNPESELRLMVVDQPYGNHNGGTIEFGPDGMLYIVFGDGGAANDPKGNGQDKGTLLGTIARIDVRAATAEKPYRIPDDNPFVGEEGARGEIWAWGLRNPWRITFDRKTGDLWCGDVGQNKYEEVDRIVKGGNYGWNVREAKHEFTDWKGPKPGGAREPRDDFIEPVVEYGRSLGGSITGGYVYRGEKIPDLVGRYVYADFMIPHLWALKEDRKSGKHDVIELCKGKVPPTLSSFAEEPEGELLITSHNGRIYRLVPAANAKGTKGAKNAKKAPD